jgi:hypothetical protein
MVEGLSLKSSKLERIYVILADRKRKRKEKTKNMLSVKPATIPPGAWGARFSLKF